jgi:hypothetical protein
LTSHPTDLPIVVKFLAGALRLIRDLHVSWWKAYFAPPVEEALLVDPACVFKALRVD